MLCAKFQNNWTYKTDFMEEQDFVRFEFKMSLIHIAQHPRCRQLIHYWPSLHTIIHWGLHKVALQSLSISVPGATGRLGVGVGVQKLQSFINTIYPSPLWQNGQHFANDIFKSIFKNEKVWFEFHSSFLGVPTLKITPSHQQNMHVFADEREAMNDIFNNHICSACHMHPRLHFKNVLHDPSVQLTISQHWFR